MSRILMRVVPVTLLRDSTSLTVTSDTTELAYWKSGPSVTSQFSLKPCFTNLHLTVPSLFIANISLQLVAVLTAMS